MSTMNRIHNVSNPNQGLHKRVLCVCSAGLLRSPTAAFVLSQPPFEYNTRAAGLDSNYALIPVDSVLLRWADEIVCMTPSQKEDLERMGCTKRIICLDIDDVYKYRDPKLMKLIAENYQERARELP